VLFVQKDCRYPRETPLGHRDVTLQSGPAARARGRNRDGYFRTNEAHARGHQTRCAVTGKASGRKILLCRIARLPVSVGDVEEIDTEQIALLDAAAVGIVRYRAAGAPGTLARRLSRRADHRYTGVGELLNNRNVPTMRRNGIYVAVRRTPFEASSSTVIYVVAFSAVFTPCWSKPSAAGRPRTRSSARLPLRFSSVGRVTRILLVTVYFRRTPSRLPTLARCVFQFRSTARSLTD
jgi:hypothetical protein